MPIYQWLNDLIYFAMESDIWQNDSVNDSIGDWLTENNLTAMTMTDRTTVSNLVRAAIYWMIFVVGVTGNLLVVAVVIWKLLKSPEHQAMTIFVGSLAVSDLGLLLGVTWINALLSVNPEWMFGKITCQIYSLWRSLTADCSIWNLVFICLDRYVIPWLQYNYLFLNSFVAHLVWPHQQENSIREARA